MSKRQFIKKRRPGKQEHKILLPASAYTKGIELHLRAGLNDWAGIATSVIKGRNYDAARNHIASIRKQLEFIETAITKMEEADQE